jgi:hypothetical protein
MVSLVISILAGINLVLLWLLYDAHRRIDQHRKLAGNWQQTITRLELVAKDWAGVASNYTTVKRSDLPGDKAAERKLVPAAATAPMRSAA